MEPIEMIGVCDVCGKEVNDCICPECYVCGVAGKQECYTQTIDGGCGLMISLEQVESFHQFTEKMDEQAEENARYMNKLNELYGENSS